MADVLGVVASAVEKTAEFATGSNISFMVKGAIIFPKSSGIYLDCFLQEAFFTSSFVIIPELNTDVPNLEEGDFTAFLPKNSRWWQFFVLCAGCRYWLGPATLIDSLNPYAKWDDLQVVDKSDFNSHIVNNAVAGIWRWTAQSQRGAPAFGFFGLSTGNGCGGQISQFSIPAQIERHLSAKNRGKAVCLIYGRTGWKCLELILLLFHEAEASLDAKVFYDVSNCRNDFYIWLHVARAVLNVNSIPDYFKENSFWQMKLQYTTRLYIRTRRLGRRTLKIVASPHLILWMPDRLALLSINRFLGRILRQCFRLSDGNRLRRRLNSVVMVPPASGESTVGLGVAECLAKQCKTTCRCRETWICLLKVFQLILVNSANPLRPHEAKFLRTGQSSVRTHVSRIFQDQVTEHVMDDLTNTLNLLHFSFFFVDARHSAMLGNVHVTKRFTYLIATEHRGDGCR